MLILFLLFVFISSFSLSAYIKTKLSYSSNLLTALIAFWAILLFSSILFTACRLAGLNFGYFLSVFFASALSITLINFKRVQKSILEIKKSLSHQNVILPISLCIGTALLSILFFQTAQRWGTWDAWTIWNLHAKFLSADSTIFKMYEEPVFTALDYPLFLPSLIAILWKLSGTVSPIEPIAISFITTLSVLFVAYAFLKNHNKFLAIIISLLLASDFVFIQIGAWQYADTLLSLFLLISICLFSEKQKTKTLPFYIGLFSAACGWIKNEGILLFLIFSLFYLIKNIKQISNIFWYLLGTIIPLSTAFIYKFNFAPQNDFLSQLSTEDIFTRIVDVSRYAAISSYFLIDVLTHHIPFLVLLSLLFILRKLKPTVAAGVMLSISAAYFAVYLSTNSDLMWNLSTSANRLFQHLYPSFIYLALLSLSKSEHPYLQKASRLIK